MVVLEVRGVTKTFAAPVLDKLTFTINKGEAVGIIGPNGAGKTTLLNVIVGDIAPDMGTVHFRGADITSVAANMRCKLGIAKASQIPRPFEGLTVFENVLTAATFGQSTDLIDPVDLAVDALESSGLLSKANQTVGSMTLLDRKRLELARALATQPEVLLLDEIAGGLTEAEVRVLVEKIQQIHNSGMTIIWIEHIVHALLEVAQRLFAMNFGQKIADGEPHEVMASTAVREVYLGVGVE